jgi:hypothetical protein
MRRRCVCTSRRGAAQARRPVADPPRRARAGGFLYIASSAFMLTLVVGIFWQNNLFYLIISVVGAILFSAYLLYDIQARPALHAAAGARLRARALAGPRSNAHPRRSAVCSAQGCMRPVQDGSLTEDARRITGSRRRVLVQVVRKPGSASRRRAPCCSRDRTRVRPAAGVRASA